MPADLATRFFSHRRSSLVQAKFRHRRLGSYMRCRWVRCIVKCYSRYVFSRDRTPVTRKCLEIRDVPMGIVRKVVVWRALLVSKGDDGVCLSHYRVIHPYPYPYAIVRIAPDMHPKTHGIQAFSESPCSRWTIRPLLSPPFLFAS